EWRAGRENDRELVFVESRHVVGKCVVGNDVPTVFLLDQRLAPHRTRRVFPAEGKIGLLAVVHGADLDQRLAAAAEIDALLRSNARGAYARPNRVVEQLLEVWRGTDALDDQRVARRPVD